MSASFVQTGGVRIGGGFNAACFNATWPFANLVVGDENLMLVCLWRNWTFSKKSIRRLSKHRGLFSSGLRIEHDIALYPAFIVFWSMGFVELKSELEKSGYVVS